MEAFFYLLIVFVIIIIALRLKVSLGITLLIASVLLGLFFKLEIINFFKLILTTLLEKDSTGARVTIELVVILYLIPIIEILMRKSGIFDRMITSINYFIKDDRKVTVFFPIFLGLLPSAGGARFSAPMTGKASERLNIKGDKKSFINYWFRHIWEPIFPLYPGIILAAFLSKIPLSDISKLHIYYSLFMLVTGWFVAFRGVPKIMGTSEPEGENKPAREHLIALAEGLFPILFLLAAVLFFKVRLIISLTIVILFLIFIYKHPFKEILGFLKQAFSLEIVLLIFGVMYFKNILEVSGAVNDMSKFFNVINLPMRVILFAMPFLIGMLTGVVQAFIAITFPLLFPLIMINGGVNLHMLSFAYISGYVGVLLSPVHLCYLLSCEYFDVEITDVYPYLLLLTPFLIVIGLIISVL